MLKENTIITNFQPHFHLRGKAMQVEAILPDGRTQMISYVENFNFNWMTNYIYADDAAPAFPKGTIIHVTAFYDNTKANKNNPDPDQWVGYGDRTVDEMAHAWMNVVYLTDAEYQEWLAQHKKPTTNDDRQQNAATVAAREERDHDHAPTTALQASMNRARPAPGARPRALVAGVVVSAQLPSTPPKEFGASVTPAYDGWYDNPDGTHTFLIGYYNRNTEQEVDIPIGPNNHFEPGNPDRRPADALPDEPQLRHVHRSPCRRSSPRPRSCGGC